MEYIITKKVEAKNITEAIKREKDADIINIQCVEKEIKEEQKYGFQQ